MACMTREGDGGVPAWQSRPHAAVSSWGELRKTGVPLTSVDALTLDGYGTLIDWRREMGEIGLRLAGMADLVRGYQKPVNPGRPDTCI